MIPRSKNFRGWLASFGRAAAEPIVYVEGCEQVPVWLAEANDGFLAFRDEFAVHIRESSYPPSSNETQWSTDEWLRDVWFDVFGPDAPPGDPYPVPARDWGHKRLTWYMLYAINDDEEASLRDGAPAWLAERGLTAAEVYNVRPEDMLNVRPQPADYADHLKRLTTAGLREPQPGDPSYVAPDPDDAE